MLAPIVLFIYNRPKHTSKVLEALKANPEAKESDLFIYCDGPRENSTEFELEQIEETRKIARSISGFKKIDLIESKQNKGLAASIIEGVTEIVNQYGRIIVLEDDIVTSKGFLKYMNEGLNCYQNTNRVMQISGYVFPFHTNFNYLDTFFYKPGSCWGWGTWKKAWSHFEKSPLKLMNELSNKKSWDEFTVYGTYPSYKTQIEQNISGKINTWAIFWYASIFLKGGTTLMPTVSLVQNIGLDGTGENSGEWSQNNPFHCIKLAEKIPVKKKWNYASKNENKMLRNAFREKLQGNLFKEKTYSIRDYIYLFRKNIILKFHTYFNKFTTNNS